MVIILMGVSGSGKTTIGKLLSGKTGCPFYDGDDFHPQSNIEKMAKGIPLQDADRIAWIKNLLALINNKSIPEKIIACSALSSFIRSMFTENAEEKCNFVFLKGNFELIKSRIDRRKNHYMKSGLLASQFETLEIPTTALTIDIASSPEDICQKIIAHVFENKPFKPA